MSTCGAPEIAFVLPIRTSEGFGLDPPAIRERFAGYCARFDLLD
jgi:hypothetical protein